MDYLIDLNATQAAIRAGYSKKTAAQQAYRTASENFSRRSNYKRESGAA